jgi:hypothetical protein
MTSETPRPANEIWRWPDSLDALVAAPGHHALLLENERTRVVRTRILPGQIVPVHTHRWPGVLFITVWSDLLRRDPQGTVLLDTRQLPVKPGLNVPQWQEPLPPHTVENVGSAEFDAVQVEMKDGAGSFRPLKFRRLPDTYAIVHLASDAAVPSWAAKGDFTSITRTADELSLVCRTVNVPKDVDPGLRWICFKLKALFLFHKLECCCPSLSHSPRSASRSLASRLTIRITFWFRRALRKRHSMRCWKPGTIYYEERRFQSAAWWNRSPR